jgi:hypothetical protein
MTPFTRFTETGFFNFYLGALLTFSRRRGSGDCFPALSAKLTVGWIGRTAGRADNPDRVSALPAEFCFGKRRSPAMGTVHGDTAFILIFYRCAV